MTKLYRRNSCKHALIVLYVVSVGFAIAVVMNVSIINNTNSLMYYQLMLRAVQLLAV